MTKVLSASFPWDSLSVNRDSHSTKPYNYNKRRPGSHTMENSKEQNCLITKRQLKMWSNLYFCLKVPLVCTISYIYIRNCIQWIYTASIISVQLQFLINRFLNAVSFTFCFIYDQNHGYSIDIKSIHFYWYIFDYICYFYVKLEN